MVVPQAFAGSTGAAERGWLTHFLGQSPIQTPGNGFQDASDPGALIVQPVVVAAHVSVQKRVVATRTTLPSLPAPGVSHVSDTCTAGTAVSYARLMGSSIQALGP